MKPSINNYLSVSSFLFQYPNITFSPLTKISPSSAIFTWFPLNGGPTVSTFILCIGLQLTTGDVSVNPYPCSVGSPTEFKNSPISLSRAPPPETKAFKFPPNCFFIFFLTNTSTMKIN